MSSGDTPITAAKRDAPRTNDSAPTINKISPVTKENCHAEPTLLCIFSILLNFNELKFFIIWALFKVSVKLWEVHSDPNYFGVGVKATRRHKEGAS